MYEDGIKTEEYREITPYWCNRLLRLDEPSYVKTPLGTKYWKLMLQIERRDFADFMSRKYRVHDFTHVRFHDGYTPTTLFYKIKDITVGKGNPDWGAPEHETFIIKLGKRIETK